jgi:hypothetical protein
MKPSMILPWISGLVILVFATLTVCQALILVRLVRALAEVCGLLGRLL